MRRKDREVTDVAVIEGIIEKAKYMHLGLFDGDHPYVVPLHYGYTMDKGKLTFYMHCAKEGHKLDCIKANGNVFVEIDKGQELVEGNVACNYSATFESVMASGTATFVEADNDKAAALKLIMKNQTGKEFDITDKMAAATCVIKVDVDWYTCKINN